METSDGQTGEEGKGEVPGEKPQTPDSPTPSRTRADLLFGLPVDYRNDVTYADGGCFCTKCGKRYLEHSFEDDGSVILCEGDTIRLLGDPENQR